MDEKTKDLLVRVLDMNEWELRAALIAIVEGNDVGSAIDEAYNADIRLWKKQFCKQV